MSPAKENYESKTCKCLELSIIPQNLYSHGFFPLFGEVASSTLCTLEYPGKLLKCTDTQDAWTSSESEYLALESKNFSCFRLFMVMILLHDGDWKLQLLFKMFLSIYV
jgi:hypothetical protein